MRLDKDDLVAAIEHMRSIVEYEPDNPDVQVPYHNLPYGMWPGQGRSELVELATEAQWQQYRWNPPQFSDHTESQPDCAAKPTWAQLVEWAIHARQQQAIQRLRTAIEHRITRGYGEENPQDENHQRLKAMEPGADSELQRRITAGHAERDRLLTRYHEIKTWLLTLTDLDQLKNLTFETDDYWTTTWSPPA